MILRPRPENHPRPEPPRRALLAAVGPPPPCNLPALDCFAAPPWNRPSPEWLQIEDSLPADHRARAINEAVDQLDLTALFATYRFIRRKRAPGLKEVDILIPIGVASQGSKPGRSACPPACCITPSASAATSTPAPTTRTARRSSPSTR